MNFITRKLVLVGLLSSIVGHSITAMQTPTCKDMNPTELLPSIKNLPIELRRHIISLLLQRFRSCSFQFDKVISLEYSNPSSVAFRPDGKIFLIGYTNTEAYPAIYKTGRDAQLLNVETEEEIQGLSGGHTGPINAIAVSSTGEVGLTGGWDKTVRLWSLKTGKLLTTLPAPAHVYSVTFSPDGETCLMGTATSSAYLVNFKTGIHTPLLGHIYRVHSVAFSSDGKTCLTGSDDKTACVWNSKTGELIVRFTQHTRPITSVAFSHNGEMCLTGSGDNKAYVWDSKTGERITILQKHARRIIGVAISPDGETILTASDDNTVGVWKRLAGFSCLTPAKKEMAFKLFMALYPLIQSVETTQVD